MWNNEMRVQYDYRDANGRLFSTIAPTLAEARQKRDEQIARWRMREGGPRLDGEDLSRAVANGAPVWAGQEE
jgi:hypothetical protein